MVPVAALNCRRVNLLPISFIQRLQALCEIGFAERAVFKSEEVNGKLEDVLRWPKSAVKVEHHDESGHSDYELGSPSSVVIEAKREGITFVLPTGWDKPIARL